MNTSRRNKKTLPKTIIPLPNPDKGNHEQWYTGRDLLDIPAPYAMLIIGPRGSGKSTLIKNLLCRADPLYETGYLIHFDPNTKEYEGIDINILPVGYIPSNEEIDPEGKKILIFEDIPYETLSKEDDAKLKGLIKYTVSHKLMSMIWTSHDFSSVPTQIRRLFNVFVIYKCPDLSSLRVIGTKVGLKGTDFQELFKQFIKEMHDFVLVDCTKKTPCPLRINGYKKITVADS